VRDFLANRFAVAPDVSSMLGRVEQVTRRIAGGLATWAPRVEVPSNLIRVIATAGSGKTQLALKLLRDASAVGQRAAYICFNRPLADHLSQLVPASVMVETYHEFARRVCRQAGIQVDFTDAGAFERLSTECVRLMDRRPADLELLVIDEVQDLQPEWVEALLSRLAESGRAVLMEDPDQQLYADREPFDLPDAATITSRENFRSPRCLVGLVNLLRLTAEPVDALAVLDGELPQPLEYTTPGGCERATEVAVARCMAKGFDVADIAVITMRGLNRSRLLGLDRLGAHAVRRFTGRHDEDGAPVWTRGALLVESVRRFKGQAAAAVVLTECDFEELTQPVKRLLFVGLTRARMHVEWVISESAARAVARAMQ
jgi:hypothetical protein